MRPEKYSIVFKNLSYFLNFGLLPEEQTLGQRIYIDINLDILASEFECNDDISTVYDYRTIDLIIKDIIKNKRYKLLEHLAKTIAENILKNNEIMRTTITIRKPSVPISEVLDHVEVSLTFKNI